MNSKKKPFRVDVYRRHIINIVCGPGCVLLAEGMITLSGDQVVTDPVSEQQTLTFRHIPFKKYVLIVEIDSDHVVFHDDNLGVIKLQPHNLSNSLTNTSGRATCLTFSFIGDVKNDDKEEEPKMNDKCITHLLQDGEPFWDLDSNSLCFYSEKSNEIIPYTDVFINGNKRAAELRSIAFNNRYRPLGSLPTRYRGEQVLWYRQTKSGSPQMCYVNSIGIDNLNDQRQQTQYQIIFPQEKDREMIIYEVDNEKFSQTPSNEKILRFRRKHDIPEYTPIYEASRVRKLFDEGIIEYSFNPSTFKPGQCYRIKTHQLSIDAILTNDVSSDGLTFGRFIRGDRNMVRFTITPDQLVLGDIEIIKL